jgi:hypothetical protein
MSVARPTEKPLAWTEVRSALEELKREQVVEPETVSAIEQQLQALQEQPAQQWYSQSTLEASDALRQQTASSIAGLQENLDNASQALEAMQNSSNPSSTSSEASEWEKAIKGLESGKMPLNKSALSALKNANFKQMSPEQMQQLQGKVCENAKACQGALADLGKWLDSHCKGNGAPKPGSKKPKPGGTGGGKQSADMDLAQSPTKVTPEKNEGVSNPDMEHASIGDVIRTSSGEHKVDESEYKGPQTAGTLVSPGAGGEAVWKQELDPAEREVLKRYYR